MKTMSLKNVMVSCLATIIALISSCGLAFGQTSTATSTLPTLQKEKAVINKDVARISLQQDKVKSLREKKMDQITSDEAITTRSELIKAHADLDKAKAYLRADKIDFLKAHQAYIDERKGAINKEKADIRSTQKSLNMALAHGNASAVLYARQLVDQKNAMQQNQTALKQEITSRNNDLLATNKKIKEVKGEPAATLAFEDSWAKSQNAMVQK